MATATIHEHLRPLFEKGKFEKCENFQIFSKVLPPTGFQKVFDSKMPMLQTHMLSMSMFDGTAFYILPTGTQLPPKEDLKRMVTRFVETKERQIVSEEEIRVAQSFNMESFSKLPSYFSPADEALIGVYLSRTIGEDSEMREDIVVVVKGGPRYVTEYIFEEYMALNRDSNISVEEFWTDVGLSSIKTFATEMRRRLVIEFVQSVWQNIEVSSENVRDQFTSNITLDDFNQRLIYNSNSINGSDIHDTLLFYNGPHTGFKMLHFENQPFNTIIPLSAGLNSIDNLVDREHLKAEQYGLLWNKNDPPLASYKNVYINPSKQLMDSIDNKLNTIDTVDLQPHVVYLI